MRKFSNRGIQLSIVGILGLSLLTGCSPMHEAPTEKTTAYIENFQLTGPEKEGLIGDVHPAIYTTVNRNNEGAEQMSISVVPKEGKEVQVPTGRYVITGYPVGNIFVYDEKGELIITEIVGSYAGSASLTVDLDSSYTIRADGGYDNFELTPFPTNLNNEALTAGLWKVGTDIEAGSYNVTIQSRYGYLQILEEGKEPELFELIGGGIGKSESRVELKDGQVVRVTKTSQILFERVD